VSSVVSEAGAARHAHLGQGPRSNSPSAEPADQASPFASWLDGTSDTSPPTTSPPPAAPPPQLPGQKPALRPQDGRTTQSSPETAPSTQKSPSGEPAPATQTGAVSSPPAKSAQATDSTQSVLALGLVKAALKDTKSTIRPTVDATATNTATDATAGNTAVDPVLASSTVAALTDTHDDKTAKPDSSATGPAQPTTPPADLSANQANSATAPVAVAITATVIPAAAIDNGSGSGKASGTGQDAARIAALGDSAKAGALSGKTGPEATNSGTASAGPGASTPADLGGAANPQDPKIADAVKTAPALRPPPGQANANPPAGPGQPNAADGSQSRNGDAVATTQAVIDHAHQRAATSQPADGTAGPQSGSNNSSNNNSSVDPNADPKRDPAASASRIVDITQQALDTAVRRSDALAAEAGSGGASRADGVQSGSSQPSSPDGGLVAPSVLTTTAAPTSAPTTNATPTAIPVAGLAVEIAAHAHAGKNRFEIRLDPPELGRIDVRLDVDRDGKVTSRLVVDRPQTLDMLRRDAPELERSLQQAGLKTADNALQFSLRDQGGFGSQNPYSSNGSPASAARVVIPDRDMAPVDAATSGYGRAVGNSTGLDIRV
jgi:flagellar hook-length control protein FliK